MNLLKLFLILACALLARGALGQTVTCTAANITLNFGAFDVLGGAVLDGAGSFTVTCVNPLNGARIVVYTATLATAPARQMAPPSGADRLSYGVFVDASRLQPWGDGTLGTFTITGTLNVPRRSSLTSAPHNYFARITPGGQDVSAASPGPPPTTYTQTLTVTVSCTPVPPC
jgi:spore coat protein U domain-containing protein, fimbrial subunit CupE1/2/3/6